MIDWENLNKVKLASSDESEDKHDIVKLLLVRMLLRKHRNEKNYIRIYTEFNVNKKRRCDIYFENIKTKESYIFEIQKSITNKWLIQTRKDYKEELEQQYLMTTDLIIIDLNKLSDDLKELTKQLEDYLI